MCKAITDNKEHIPIRMSIAGLLFVNNLEASFERKVLLWDKAIIILVASLAYRKVCSITYLNIRYYVLVLV